MQHSWTSPPTRRELFLLTFSLSIFVLAYNADAVLPLIRHPATLALPIGPDGRKGAPHTDALEDAIAGTWDWAPNRIAGLSDAEDARTLRGFQEDGDVYVRGEGRAGQQALWLRGVGQGRYTTDKARLGDSSINEEFVRWGSNVPRTSVALHAPGFTVLDNVTLAFGTFFLVGEDDGTLPRPEVLGSSLEDHSKPPRDIDWQILPTSNSVAKLGTYGGRMHGTTFVSYDDFTDGHTLLALTRLHSLLPPPVSPLIPRFSFAAPGPSPARLLLPAIRTFTEPGPDPSPKSHSSTGVHPSTLLAAYPSLAGPLFHDDFDDFTGLSGPMLIDRVIVVDRGAAARSLSASTSASSAESGSWVRNAPAGVPPHLAVFAADENKRWFEDVRRTLWEALGFAGAEVEKGVARGQEEIAYVVPKEGRVDEGLVKALRGLGRTVHVLGGSTGTSWAEHMRAVARSSIIVSSSGPHLSDAAFIRPGPRAALVELFPPGAFDRDWEVVMSSMGHGFVGFQGRKRVDNPTQHPISRPASPGPLQIDASAIADSVKEILARH